MISSRPSNMSVVRTTLETSLKGSNEPIGLAKPKAGPTLAMVVAAAAIAWDGVSGTSARAESIRMTSAPLATIPT
jgi:hypothetical protein